MKPVVHSLYLKTRHDNYWIGNLDISPKRGELFYRPSQNISVSGGKYYPTKGYIKTRSSMQHIDHFSFMSDGDAHQTNKRRGPWEKHISIQRAQFRLPIHQVGQQFLLRDDINNIFSLPLQAIPEGHHVYFNVPLNIKKVFLRIDLISGRNIVNNDLQKIPLEDKEGKFIEEHTRAMGVIEKESNGVNKINFADKIIFLSLFLDKREEAMPTNRRVIVFESTNKKVSFS